MPRRRALLYASCCAVLLTGAAPAAASTLTRSGDALTFTAAPTTQNTTSVTREAGPPGTTTISTIDDPVAYPLPANCQDVDQQPAAGPAYSVRCTNVETISLDLLDLSDVGITNGVADGVTFNGGAGSDNLNGSEGSQTLNGGAGEDTVTGGGGNDVIDGGDGNDPDLSGGGGNDFITGGAGDDALTGNAGTDEIDGGAGADQLTGGADPDVLRGGDGDDTLSGGTGTDTLNGQAGDDAVSGGDDNDLADGGDGDDAVDGNDGTDTLFGADGVDTLDGGAGGDTMLGGTGADILYDDAGPAADVLRGGSDADVLVASIGGAGDLFDGGEGFDGIVAQAPADTDVITIDLAEGRLASGTDTDDLVALEDISQAVGYAAYTFSLVPNPVFAVGTAGTNTFALGSGDDTADPGAGNDVVYAGGGADKVTTRDGFSDRVACGPGADTATVDALDEVAADCEVVDRAVTPNANDTPEDAPPAVAITSPSSAAVLSTVAPNTITATASDDRGIAQVIFSTGERTLCVDTTAPYSCDYRPTAADVGRDTLIAVAVDSAGQTASAVRGVNVPRFKATGLSAATTPRRDARAPFTFTTKGRLTLPAGVPGAAGCKGVVTVSFKAGRKTVSTRRVSLRSNCSYASKVTFRLPGRLNPRTLSVVAVFGGNDVLDSATAKRHTVRPR